MIKILKQLTLGKYTVLCLDKEIPHGTSKYVVIDGNKYEISIVYDLPKHIAIVGDGNFEGKEVEFI